MSEKHVEPCIFAIFGGTGDLAQRKLIPALARLAKRGLLNERCHVLAIARSADYDDASFRTLARQALERSGLSAEDAARLDLSKLHYQSIGQSSEEDYRALAKRLEAIEREHDLPQNRAFYLALPTGALPKTSASLAAAGLNRSQGWTRIVVEKPFGHDLASARELNELVHEHFEESQVYRIDHYLGKETVQNLMVFRFANVMIESLWHRDRIRAVQIMVSEDLGVGSRAGYYDQSGAMRDMLQNHLTQVLSLVAMEVPVAFEADAIRHEKIKVLRSIAPIVPSNVVYGQYTAGSVGGEQVPGYLEEEGINASSRTESFVAMKLEIDSWRWQGVPFYLRTGKRLPQRTTQIAVRFRNAPVCLFNSMGQCAVSSNLLVLTLQPDEGFSMHIDVKKPGSPLDLQRLPLSFKYKDVFDEVPEAYETLVFDVLAGDQTLFVHADEVEASWQLYDALLTKDHPLHPYAAGSWGPKEADHLALIDEELWGKCPEGKRFTGPGHR